jgi:hypothetical protein
MCGSAVCGTATWGDAPTVKPDLDPIDIGLLVAGGVGLARGAVDVGEGLIGALKGLFGVGEPAIQTLGIAGLRVTAEEVATRAISAIGSPTIRVESEAVAQQAADRFLGSGARPISGARPWETGAEKGWVSADGQRVVRFSHVDAGGGGPHWNFQNKLTGGNLHVYIK